MDGLSLLVLRSADLAAAHRFYACFDLDLVRHRHGDGPEHLSAVGDAGVLEIYPADSDGPDPTGLGFTVDDLQVTGDRLREAGFHPGEARARPWGTSFVVRDGDGRRVEVRAR